MTIIDKRGIDNNVPAREIEVGKCFQLGTLFYMRILNPPYNYLINAVRLNGDKAGLVEQMA